MGLFHSQRNSGYPKLDKDGTLGKVNLWQYFLHHLYGKYEPVILRLGDYLIKRFHKFSISKPKKANRTRKLLMFLNSENFPRTLVISTPVAKNILEFVLKTDGPQGARLAVGPCPCQMALDKHVEPMIKDMVILYGADVYTHLNKGYEVISLAEGKNLLDKFHEAGLVHNLEYCMQSGKWVFVICNCDSEICVSYRGDEIVGDIMRNGPEIAEKVEAKCIGADQCGACIRRCIYKANSIIDGKLVYDPEKCRGCGLCVSTCLGEAMKMIPRDYYKYEHVVPAQLMLKNLYDTN